VLCDEKDRHRSNDDALRQPAELIKRSTSVPARWLKSAQI
jgi:hypothetical protein